jgi:isopenicillin N synthase-like dioxygenase
MLNPTAPRKNPETIESHRKDCEDFFRRAHSAICTLLSHLDKQLALAPGTLAALSPLEKPSETSLRFLLSRPEPVVETNTRVSLPGHTDIGTITMLFHTTGGLQILPANQENEEANWRYIRPEPGCALINIGDTLVEWTGGVLRSALHRVVAPPGKQGSVARQSLAYLVRADNNATMRRLKSDGVVPGPGQGDEETFGVYEWAAKKVKAITTGEVRPQGRGGKFVDYKRFGKV